MRIAQVSPYDIDRPGGVQTHIRDLAAALAARGHETLIIAPASRGAAPDADPAVARVGRSWSVPFNRTRFEVSLARGGERRRLAALLDERRFDVVHLHTPWTPFLPLQVLAAARATAVATFHDVPPDTPAGRATRRVFRGLSRVLQPRLGAAIATSEASAANLAPVAGRRVHVVPPCVDLSRFLAGAPPFPDFRDGKLNILFLGRLDRRKGVMDLVEAYRRLCRDGAAARLIVAGEGDLAGALRRAVARDGVPEVVLVGAVAERDKPRWYATADVFCAPSHGGEGFGIVLVEAMASGKPVVAAANPGYRAVLGGDGARGLFAPGDAAGLHRTLDALAGDAGLRARLGTWGRETAARYDAARVAPDILAVYDEALALER